MFFNKTGSFDVTITNAMLATSQFSPNDENAFDICLLVETEDNQSDWWRGEISSKYGRGNFANMTQTEITMQTLIKIGWKHGSDISKLGTLIGTKTVATVKATEKAGDDGVNRTYYNVAYLAANSRTPEAIDASEAQRRLAAIMGNPAPAQAQNPPQTATNYDPFAPKK